MSFKNGALVDHSVLHLKTVPHGILNVHVERLQTFSCIHFFCFVLFLIKLSSELPLVFLIKYIKYSMENIDICT